jgi:YVTN family beta-propeller protein
LLYASDEEGGRVLAVDPSHHSVVACIDVGEHPRRLAASRDGTRLYVAGETGVDVVDLSRRVVAARLPGVGGARDVDESSDGRTLFVAERSRVSAIDVATSKLRAVAPIDDASAVRVEPDGRAVFAASLGRDEIVVLDPATLAVSGRIPVGHGPRAIVFSHDGRLAFVADEGAAKVTFVDAFARAALQDVPLHEDSPMPSGPRPAGMTTSPDDKLLYVACGRGGSLAIVDIASRRQVRSIDGVGDRPSGVALGADGARVYTANGPSHDLSIVDLASGNVVRRVALGGLPSGLVAVP